MLKKVMHLKGRPAFKAKEEELGAALIDNLAMEGGTAHVIPAPGNWIYQGKPDVTDAYAPANATVASPGDVPKAPAPAPTQASSLSADFGAARRPRFGAPKAAL